MLEKVAASVATTAEVMGEGYAHGLAIEDGDRSTYIFSDENPPSSVSTLPALAAQIADYAETLLQFPMAGARLHWSSRVANEEDAWQTCQRPEEVDLSLYLRIDRADSKLTESTWQVRQPSPNKRFDRMWRRWVHSRSTMTYAHLKALEQQQFLVTRNSDVLDGKESEEVVWVFVRHELVDLILELRLISGELTQALRPFFKESIEGVREQMYAVHRTSILFGSLSLLQVILLSTASAVLKLSADVELLCFERSSVRRSDAVGEALIRGLRGMMGSRSGEGGTLKGSLEAILSELCRLPTVVEIKAECTDTSEGTLLFKSFAKRDRVEFKELVPTIAGTSSVTVESVPISTQDEEIDNIDVPVYDLNREEYTLEHRDIKGNLTVIFSKSNCDLRIMELLSRLKLFEVIAKVLSPRVYELNKARKSKLALKRMVEEQNTLMSAIYLS